MCMLIPLLLQDLVALNYAMFRCEHEEEATPYAGGAAYNVPSVGNLLYCGLQGVVPLLEVCTSLVFACVTRLCVRVPCAIVCKRL